MADDIQNTTTTDNGEAPITELNAADVLKGSGAFISPDKFEALKKELSVDSETLNRHEHIEDSWARYNLDFVEAFHEEVRKSIEDTGNDIYVVVSVPEKDKGQLLLKGNDNVQYFASETGYHLYGPDFAIKEILSYVPYVTPKGADGDIAFDITIYESNGIAYKSEFVLKQEELAFTAEAPVTAADFSTASGADESITASPTPSEPSTPTVSPKLKSAGATQIPKEFFDNYEGANSGSLQYAQIYDFLNRGPGPFGHNEDPAGLGGGPFLSSGGGRNVIFSDFVREDSKLSTNDGNERDIKDLVKLAREVEDLDFGNFEVLAFQFAGETFLFRKLKDKDIDLNDDGITTDHNIDADDLNPDGKRIEKEIDVFFRIENGNIVLRESNGDLIEKDDAHGHLEVDKSGNYRIRFRERDDKDGDGELTGGFEKDFDDYDNDLQDAFGFDVNGTTPPFNTTLKFFYALDDKKNSDVFTFGDSNAEGNQLLRLYDLMERDGDGKRDLGDQVEAAFGHEFDEVLSFNFNGKKYNFREDGNKDGDLIKNGGDHRDENVDRLDSPSEFDKNSTGKDQRGDDEIEIYIKFKIDDNDNISFKEVDEDKGDPDAYFRINRNGKYELSIEEGNGPEDFSANPDDAIDHILQRLAEGQVISLPVSFTYVDKNGNVHGSTLYLEIRGSNDEPKAYDEIFAIDGEGNIDVDASENANDLGSDDITDDVNSDKTGGLGAKTHDDNSDGVIDRVTGNVLGNDDDVDIGSRIEIKEAEYNDPDRDDNNESFSKPDDVTNGHLTLQGEYGVLHLFKNGTFEYFVDQDKYDDINPGDNAKDTFDYTIVDEHGATSTATLTIDLKGSLPNAPAFELSVRESGKFGEGIVKWGGEGNAGFDEDKEFLELDGDESDIFEILGFDNDGEYKVKEFTFKSAESSDSDIDVSDLNFDNSEQPDRNSLEDNDSILTIRDGSGSDHVLGKLRLGESGDIAFDVNNLHPDIEALQAGETLKFTFEYEFYHEDDEDVTAKETFTIIVQGKNDAPIVAVKKNVNGNLSDNIDVINTKSSGTDEDNDGDQDIFHDVDNDGLYQVKIYITDGTKQTGDTLQLVDRGATANDPDIFDIQHSTLSSGTITHHASGEIIEFDFTDGNRSLTLTARDGEVPKEVMEEIVDHLHFHTSSGDTSERKVRIEATDFSGDLDGDNNNDGRTFKHGDDGPDFANAEVTINLNGLPSSRDIKLLVKESGDFDYSPDLSERDQKDIFDSDNPNNSFGQEFNLFAPHEGGISSPDGGLEVTDAVFVAGDSGLSVKEKEIEGDGDIDFFLADANGNDVARVKFETDGDVYIHLHEDHPLVNTKNVDDLKALLASFDVTYREKDGNQDSATSRVTVDIVGNNDTPIVAVKKNISGNLLDNIDIINAKSSGTDEDNDGDQDIFHDVDNDGLYQVKIYITDGTKQTGDTLQLVDRGATANDPDIFDIQHSTLSSGTITHHASGEIIEFDFTDGNRSLTLTARDGEVPKEVMEEIVDHLHFHTSSGDTSERRVRIEATDMAGNDGKTYTHDQNDNVADFANAEVVINLNAKPNGSGPVQVEVNESAHPDASDPNSSDRNVKFSFKNTDADTDGYKDPTLASNPTQDVFTLAGITDNDGDDLVVTRIIYKENGVPVDTADITTSSIHTITTKYGVLEIDQNGNMRFILDNSVDAVDNLHDNETLLLGDIISDNSEIEFVYEERDPSTGAVKSTQTDNIKVLINGVNDLPRIINIEENPGDKFNTDTPDMPIDVINGTDPNDPSDFEVDDEDDTHFCKAEVKISNATYQQGDALVLIDRPGDFITHTVDNDSVSNGNVLITGVITVDAGHPAATQELTVNYTFAPTMVNGQVIYVLTIGGFTFNGVSSDEMPKAVIEDILELVHFKTTSNDTTDREIEVRVWDAQKGPSDPADPRFDGENTNHPDDPDTPNDPDDPNKPNDPNDPNNPDVPVVKVPVNKGAVVHVFESADPIRSLVEYGHNAANAFDQDNNSANGNNISSSADDVFSLAGIEDGGTVTKIALVTPTGLVGNVVPDIGEHSITTPEGTLYINKNGDIRFEVDNSNAAVQALNEGNSIEKEFSFEYVQNGKTFTNALKITINGVNDKPRITTVDNDPLAGMAAVVNSAKADGTLADPSVQAVDVIKDITITDDDDLVDNVPYFSEARINFTGSANDNFQPDADFLIIKSGSPSQPLYNGVTITVTGDENGGTIAYSGPQNFDVLNIDGSSGGVSKEFEANYTYDAANGELYITASNTYLPQEVLQAILEQVHFTSTSAETGDREIVVRVSDTHGEASDPADIFTPSDVVTINIANIPGAEVSVFESSQYSSLRLSGDTGSSLNPVINGNIFLSLKDNLGDPLYNSLDGLKILSISVDNRITVATPQNEKQPIIINEVFGFKFGTLALYANGDYSFVLEDTTVDPVKFAEFVTFVQTKLDLSYTEQGSPETKTTNFAIDVGSNTTPVTGNIFTSLLDDDGNPVHFSNNGLTAESVEIGDKITSISGGVITLGREQGFEFGTLTIQANGDYTFVLNNDAYLGDPNDPLRTIDHLAKYPGEGSPNLQEFINFVKTSLLLNYKNDTQDISANFDIEIRGHNDRPVIAVTPHVAIGSNNKAGPIFHDINIFDTDSDNMSEFSAFVESNPHASDTFGIVEGNGITFKSDMVVKTLDGVRVGVKGTIDVNGTELEVDFNGVIDSDGNLVYDSGIHRFYVTGDASKEAYEKAIAQIYFYTANGGRKQINVDIHDDLGAFSYQDFIHVNFFTAAANNTQTNTAIDISAVSGFNHLPVSSTISLGNTSITHNASTGINAVSVILNSIANIVGVLSLTLDTTALASKGYTISGNQITNATTGEIVTYTDGDLELTITTNNASGVSADMINDIIQSSNISSGSTTHNGLVELSVEVTDSDGNISGQHEETLHLSETAASITATAAQTVGTSGVDTIVGRENEDDAIFGNGGNDIIDGKSGNDLLVGDTGDDTLFGGAGHDVLVGGEGNDQYYGGKGGDAFVFNTIAEAKDAEIHDFNPDEGDYIFIGKDITQYIDKGAFGSTIPLTSLFEAFSGDGTEPLEFSVSKIVLRINDRVSTDVAETDQFSITVHTKKPLQISDFRFEVDGATNQNDTLEGFNENNVLAGLDGDDTLLGGRGDDVIFGDYGPGRHATATDIETGNESALIAGDFINGVSDDSVGSGGNDTLKGEEGNDYLDGGFGNDVLIGGEGTDIMIGGEGDDKFVITKLDNLNGDIFEDFGTGSDTLVFDVDAARDLLGLDATDPAPTESEVVDALNGLQTTTSGNYTMYSSGTHGISFTIAGSEISDFTGLVDIVDDSTIF